MSSVLSFLGLYLSSSLDTIIKLKYRWNPTTKGQLEYIKATIFFTGARDKSQENKMKDQACVPWVQLSWKYYEVLSVCLLLTESL